MTNFVVEMESRKALLIINPISGTSSKEGLQDKVEKRLGAENIGVDTVWTTASGDATRLAHKAVDDGYDIVVAAGGDGTINETATALCGSDTTLGIIPCGSGNGLARHLNIPVDIRASIEIIGRGNSLRCDRGSINGLPFFCTCGTGFDATVSHKFAQSKKRGKLTYIKSTFREYINYKPEEYVITTADGEVITDRAFCVAVCNASQYGNNAYIAPHASISDGLLDVTVIHYGNILTTALVGLDLMGGTIEKNMLVHTFRTNGLTIHRPNAAAVHLDGEPMSMEADLTIKCHPAELSIFAPGDDTPIRPLLTPITAMFNDIGIALRNIVKK